MKTNQAGGQQREGAGSRWGFNMHSLRHGKRPHVKHSCEWRNTAREPAHKQMRWEDYSCRNLAFDFDQRFFIRLQNEIEKLIFKNLCLLARLDVKDILCPLTASFFMANPLVQSII